MNILTRLTLLVTILTTVVLPSMAGGFPKPQPDRESWMKELRQYKHDFLTRELQLNDKQQEQFLPLYDEMDRKIGQANDKVRKLDMAIGKSETAVTDEQYEAVTKAQLELKSTEAKITKEYYPKFQKILTPKQLYMLPKVERKFTRQLMREHEKAMKKPKGLGK